MIVSIIILTITIVFISIYKIHITFKINRFKRHLESSNELYELLRSLEMKMQYNSMLKELENE